MTEETVAVARYIARINAGEQEVRDQLISIAFERLRRLTRRMKQDYDRVGRWEQTDDVFQNACVRLCQALERVQLRDVRHFYRLAAMQIRRELIDLARHYNGPLGAGAHHQTLKPRDDDNGAMAPAYEGADQTTDPRRIQQWAEFHEAVEKLPEREREVFELLWYHERSQEEVAEMLGVSTRQVKRIWRAAKLALHDVLKGGFLA